jgi:riboflavin synthase alpha subunit
MFTGIVQEIGIIKEISLTVIELPLSRVKG